jgi:hypothetical protein
MTNPRHYIDSRYAYYIPLWCFMVYVVISVLFLLKDPAQSSTHVVIVASSWTRYGNSFGAVDERVA